MTLDDLIALREQALALPALPDVEWPPSPYYRFLALLVQQTNSKVFVELGTCGGGASYNVAIMNPHSVVVSIDIIKEDQVNEIQRRCKNFRYYNGDSVKLAKTVGQRYNNKIGVLFIDTDHTYDQSVAEFEAWLPYLSPGAIVCCDDLNRPGVAKFWDEYITAYEHTQLDDLATLHIGGSPTDGGFGAILIS